MKSGVNFKLTGNTRIGGFKPFFWNLASESSLTGWIRDLEDGAELYLQGEDDLVRDFIRLLPSRVPEPFRLTSICILNRQSELSEDEYCSGFTVREDPDKIPIHVGADRKICDRCAAQALDRSDRRFEHAFFSCRECGPFYSSVLRTPFVRKNTLLTAFPPCADCKREQADEEDLLHYGSEGLSCPECGPQFFMLDMYGDLVADALHPLQQGRQAVLEGNIVALQSIYGGFQIFADAFHEEVINILRRKRKLPDRPLCLMAKDMDVIRRICICSEEEEALLCSPASPVVLLRRRKDPQWQLPENIAPGCPFLAVSLPSSLPEILFFRGAGPEEGSLELAVTCGDNPPGKAECSDVDEIFNRLMSFTDRFLCHDMKTPHPCPNSILMLHENRPLFIRKARGYVPEGIRTASILRNVGAFGCDAQASIALGIHDRICHSQSLGSLEKESDGVILQDLFDRFLSLFDRVPEIMACDMDNESLSARICSAFAEQHNLLLVTIQTHHAHALACMAEHHLTRALGIIMNDGSPGPDGTEWGSECLDARMDGFSRIASFKALSKHNSRPARLFLESLALLQDEMPSGTLLERLNVEEQEYALWYKQLLHQESVRTHSALKVINTLCAGMGIAPDFATYPMHCMTLLENYVSQYPEGREIPGYIRDVFAFSLVEENGIHVLDWSETILNLSRFQVIAEEEKPFLARAFYDAFSAGIIAMSTLARERTLVNDLVLSGSLFQNSILLSTVQHQLEMCGFRVYIQRQSACDESCVPIGQAYAAGLTEG